MSGSEEVLTEEPLSTENALKSFGGGSKASRLPAVQQAIAKIDVDGELMELFHDHSVDVIKHERALRVRYGKIFFKAQQCYMYSIAVDKSENNV